MTDESQLLFANTKYDSTPERKIPIPRARIGDASDKPSTKAWGGDDEEIQAFPSKEEKSPSIGETSFSLASVNPLGKSIPGGASPARSSEPSSPARSDTEFIKRGSSASSPQVIKQKPPKKSEETRKGFVTEESSGRLSEISSVRSGTPGSDGKSYRERIRERVQAAKERALAAGTFKQRVPKVKSPSGSRSDEFDKEEDKIEEAMKKHKEVRSKWKVAAASMHVANIQSGYEFFSKGWEAPVKSPDEETENEQKEGESSEDEKMMVTEMLGSRESDWMPVYTYQPPESTDWTKIKEKQIGLFFCPSSSPVPLEEKLEPDTSPRFIEDEGLFVGSKIKVASKRRNKLEQRIMAMGSERYWFGEDGEIKGIPDPLDYSSYNKHFTDEEPHDLVEFVPAKILEPGLLSVQGNEVYFLEIEVGHVIFRHHPLFSREHCIAEKLRALCQIKDNPAARLGGRLQALRNSRDHLLKLYSFSGDDMYLARANKQKLEIKEVRSEWLQEKRKEREQLASILETWRDLKLIREKQGYTSSCYKLRIITSEEENHEWETQYKAFVEELLEEAEEEYREKLIEYNATLSIWKKKKEKLKDEGLSSEEEILSQSDEDILEPQKPQKPNRSTLEVFVRDELHACLRPPGEPLIKVQLLENLEITPSSDNAMEEERRKVTKNWRLSVGLQVNGKQVDKAVGSKLSDVFSSDVNHRFSLKLQTQPSNLSLQIFDSGQPNVFGKKLIAQIFIPVPGKIHTDSANWCDYEFSSSDRVGPLKHTAVGSGQVELNLNEEKALYTNGFMTVRAGWADPLPNIFPHPKSSKVSKPVKDNVQKLKEWADHVQLDPNDPHNADLFEYLKAEDTKTNNDSSLNAMVFCSEDDIFNNPRLKLLMLRQSGQPEFRAMRRIPMNEKEIPKDIFKMYEKRINGRKKKVRGGSIDQERAWAREFIDQIKEEVLKKIRVSQAKTFTDMVHEEPVPDLGTLGLTFMKWLQPKRPLRPKRKKRKKYPVKSLVGQQLEIIVNIGRAFEVPVRKENDEKTPEQGYSIVPVRPFIEVVFQGERRRTNTAEGANPTWNQDLHIPIDNPHGDFNPSALQSLKESIHIHLYDEKLVDIIDDERLRETNIHQRLEKHWLASLRIPFAALYYNSRIEGTFQMYSPPVLLGYERESKEFRDSTFLTVFLIVHPPLHPPSPMQEKLETTEEIYVEQHLDQWLTEVRKIFPNRHVPTLVMDSSGKSVCVTRFIRAIQPPEMDSDMKTTPEMAARYVSLIPVVPGNLLYPGYLDIWLTADQLLGLGVCESCSGAVLLCCFMKALELQSWLLVGCGRSSGPAMYVLTKSREGDMLVWDPSTGKSFPTSHPFSPLYRIYCLIDDSNIWVNNQKDDLMSCANLDVSKRSDWWPAFGRSVGAPVGSVQPTSLIYKPTQEVKTLEGKLEKILRNAVMKLRPTYRTIWNRYCSSSLKKLLPGLERSSWSGESTSTIDHVQELQHVMSSYKMRGFPINMPYNSPTEIVDAVKSTGVHINDAPEIEFSVAVYIHPFPNNVLSVWVYIASLLRRRV